MKAFIAIAGAASAALIEAQSVSPSDARKREEQRAAAAVFVDRTRPEAERLAAVPRMGYPDSATAKTLLSVGADPTASDAIRLEALKKHPFTQEWLETVLRILNDPNDGGPLLDSGLTEHLNRRVTFRLPAELRQRIQLTWRGLLDDPRDAVRLSAYRVLIANHDPVAVARLSESLRTRTQIPIPLPEAVDLLDLDGAVNHISALRPYLDDADPAVRAQAARALAVDPQSRGRIIEMATNAQSPPEVRVQALRGLANEDDGFGRYAIAIVENSREDGEIRYAAMHSFVGRMNYHRVDEAEQIRFAQAVERVAADRELRSRRAKWIRNEAVKLLAYLKEAFPAIRRFYANR